VAPRAGFEPATDRLTADCSTVELPGNKGLRLLRSPRRRNRSSRLRNAIKDDLLIELLLLDDIIPGSIVNTLRPIG
jgi:hypothetical protein